MKALSIFLALFSFSAYASNTVSYTCKLTLGTIEQVTPIQVEVGVTQIGLINFIDLDQNSYLGGVLRTNLDGTIKNVTVGVYPVYPKNIGKAVQILIFKEVNSSVFAVSAVTPSGESVTYTCAP